MIDRSNYEIWFTDWLDKNLSASQVEELMLFIDDNPDLKEEFDNFASMSSLEPLKKSYPKHDKLKKVPSDISALQFNLLCVASMENDLDETQKADLNEMLAGNIERQKTFELISKTRLTAPRVIYRKKSLLKRNMIAGKIPFMISLVAAAASVIAIVFFSGVFNKTEPLLITENIADTIYINKPLPQVPIKPLQLQPSQSVQSKSVQAVSGVPEETTKQETIPLATLNNDPIEKTIYNVQIPGLATEINQLALNEIPIPGPLVDEYEERSKMGKFIASTFRKQVLKEKEFNDTPLKGYEIAEAGITGINKLLGWEMALTRNNDENGELKSVRFSSQMIKFNATVKKDEVDE